MLDVSKGSEDESGWYKLVYFNGKTLWVNTIRAGSRIIVQLTMELSVAIINGLQPVAVNDCHK